MDDGFCPDQAVHFVIMATGQELQHARLRRRLSREQLARKLRVSSRTILRWEQAEELPESATAIVEDFLAQPIEEPMAKTLDQATELELVLELLKRVSSGNAMRASIDTRQEHDLADPDLDPGSQT